MAFFQILFALVGWIIAFYFTGVYYKWLSPDIFWIPKICRMSEKTCVSVLDTPRAKMAGIPNSVFGLFVYAYLALDAIVFPPYLGFLLITASLARSIYLAYSLLFITRIPCKLCFTAHALNLALFLLYLLQIFALKP
jgi:uncharacterized membrane protein